MPPFKPKLKKFGFFTLVVLFNFVLLEVLLGLLSFCISPEEGNIDELAEVSENFQDKISHPYLGFVYQDFHPLDTKTLKPRSDYFVLTITGGSVAESFCNSNQNTEVLQNYLSEYVHKKVVLNCLAVGSFMQPQELLSTLLYARDTDFLVSLEGYNELFDYKDPERPDYPQSRFKKLFFSDFRENFAYRNWLYLISVTEIWAYKSDRWYDKLRTFRYVKSLMRRVFGKFFDSMMSEEEVPNEVRLKIWKKNLLDLKLLMNARHKPFVVVFQPHIYSKTEWTAREKEYIAPDGDREKIEKTLAVGQQLVSELAETGFPIVDYTRRKDFLNKRIEFVDFCHLNNESEKDFSLAVGQDIVNHLPWRR